MYAAGDEHGTLYLVLRYVDGTDLHALLEDTLALYNGLFAEVRFERSFAPSLPRVRIDTEQIKRVVINLVDNAVEAMERRGVITLETRHDAANHVVRLVVSDDGPGVPPGERARVFRRFVRLDDARARADGGAGLGLAIVAEVVAAHGGTVDVVDGPLRGALFRVSLPLPAGEEPVEPESFEPEPEPAPRPSPVPRTGQAGVGSGIR